MLYASVNVGLFFNFQIDGDPTFQLTHLQFRDDTLIIGNKIWTNIRVIEGTLLLLKLMSSWTILLGMNIVQNKKDN